MASIIGRDRLQVFIGKKGGVRIPLYRKNKNTYKQFKKMTYGDINKVNA